MKLIMETNEQGETDFDLEGSSVDTILAIVTVMDASDDFAAIIKESLKAYNKIQE